MIELKKLNGTSIFVNPDLIRVVESTPDTVVSFLDGETILVQTTPQEIIERVILFKKKCSSNNFDFEVTNQLDLQK